MTALRRRHEALRTLDLETRTTSNLGDQRVTGTVSMLVDRAGRLRFEAEAPLKGTIAALTVNTSGFALVDLDRKVFSKGPACPENVAALVGMPLAPEEITAILLGDAPLGAGARAVGVQWDERLGADVLAIERPPAGEGATRLWITMRRGRQVDDQVLAVQVLAVQGQSPWASGRWRVSYDDLEATPAGPHPALIRFAEPGRSFDEGVAVKVKHRMGVNLSLRDDVFSLSPTPGFRLELRPCPPPRPQ